MHLAVTTTVLFVIYGFGNNIIQWCVYDNLKFVALRRVIQLKNGNFQEIQCFKPLCASFHVTKFLDCCAWTPIYIKYYYSSRIGLFFFKENVTVLSVAIFQLIFLITTHRNHCHAVIILKRFWLFSSKF